MKIDESGQISDDVVKELTKHAINTIDKYDDSENLNDYKLMVKSMSKLAQVLLIKKAAYSSMAAVELSKQYPPSIPIKMDDLSAISELSLTNEQLDSIKKRVDLTPRFKHDLTPEAIKEQLKVGLLTIDEAQKLMRTANFDKIGEAIVNISLDPVWTDGI